MKSTDKAKEPSSYPVYKNAARASPLAGRHTAKKYASPLDMKNLLTPEEFQRQFIENKSNKCYKADSGVIEVPEPVKKMRRSVESPVTPVTASSTTQRSETQTSLGGDTYHENNNDDDAPSGWYALRSFD
jgi:hypothetical protein